MGRAMRVASLSSLLCALGVAEQSRPDVDLEIFYGPMCSHCMFFLSQMLPSLFKAQLPGGQVHFTLLPWILDEHGGMPDAEASECIDDASAPCHYLPAPLCALEAVDMPAPIDSGALFNAYQFMICDLAHANSASPVPQTPETIEVCARDAKVENEAWKDCYADKVQTQAYKEKVQRAWDRMEGMTGLMAPFIFINGQLLVCDEPTRCSFQRRTSTQQSRTSSSTAGKPMSHPGTLLEVVCSMLSGTPPAACKEFVTEYEERQRGPLARMAAIFGEKVEALSGLGLCALVAFVALIGVATGRRRWACLRRDRCGMVESCTEDEEARCCRPGADQDRAPFLDYLRRTSLEAATR